MPDLAKFGEKSIGVAMVMGSQPPTLRVEAVIVRRGAVVEWFYVMYVDGVKPPIQTVEVVKILDSRTATALGSK